MKMLIVLVNSDIDGSDKKSRIVIIYIYIYIYIYNSLIGVNKSFKFSVLRL